MKFNYTQVCSDLLGDLPKNQKEVISRRFGLKNGRRETLESIGKDYGITRERVRQIERDGFSKIKPGSGEYSKVLQYFKDYLKNKGGVGREDIILTDLGGNKLKNQVYFLLNLAPGFEKISETEEFYPLWTFNQNTLSSAKKAIDSTYSKLKKTGKALKLKDLASLVSLDPINLNSYLEASKKIQKNSEELFGLKEWPEINPRGIKDKAYLAFKKEQKSLHFTEVADLLENALPQTVHNELIKDARFILVGRGLYALKEWGYETGFVKDVILKTLKKANKPLNKEEVMKRVLEQRMVKANTVLLNLSNKRYFSKNQKGLYSLRTKEA